MAVFEQDILTKSDQLRGTPVWGQDPFTEMQCRMVDCSKRCPVLELTTGLTRGEPDNEQTSADIIYYKSIYAMKEVELVQKSTKKISSAPSTNTLQNSVRRRVLQLLNKEEEELHSMDLREESKSRFFIDPNSKRVMTWNILFMILFYVIQMQISLSLAFGSEFFTEIIFGDIENPIFIIIAALLVVDMVLSFFKGYYAFGRGKVIDDKYLVAKKYLITQFPFDILVIVFYITPLFDNIKENQGLIFLQLIPAFLIWVKKSRYQKQIEFFLQYRPNLRSFFTISILTIDVLMIGNYGACLFIGMDLLLYNNSVYGTGQFSPWYWLTSNTSYPYSLIYGPWYYQYIYGQQFSTGTLSTLAPGPFAKNPYQIFYSIIVMILFMVLASYVTQVIIQVMYTYTQKRIFHEDNIISFENFMQLKEVGKDIKKRIYNFFQLIWEVQLKLENKEQEEMIEKLPLYLKEELLQDIGFTKHLLFLKNLPEETAMKKLLSMRMKRSTLDSKTCIFESHLEDEQRQRSLYFLKDGVAKYYISDPQKRKGGIVRGQSAQTVLNLTNIGRVLGIYEFITGQDFSVSCSSINLCSLQSLSWKEFHQVITELHVQEPFFELQHKVLVQRQFQLISKTCVLCLKSHHESECPDLYPYQKFKAEIEFESEERVNSRKKAKRKKIKSQRITSFQSNSDRPTSLMLRPNVKIIQLLFDMYKSQKTTIEEIDAVSYFDQYFKEYNIHTQQMDNRLSKIFSSPLIPI